MADLTLKDLLRHNKEVDSSAPALDLEPVKKVLGEDMPQIDETQVGRIRLIRALAQKYGMGYRAKPGVKEAIDHYDKEANFIKLYKKTLGDHHGR